MPADGSAGSLETLLFDLRCPVREDMTGLSTNTQEALSMARGAK